MQSLKVSLVTAAVVCAGMVLLIQLFPNQAKQIWDLRLGGYPDPGAREQTTTQKGSQYLLGVGKADITG